MSINWPIKTGIEAGYDMTKNIPCGMRIFLPVEREV
jgi:hypothetical protein